MVTIKTVYTQHSYYQNKVNYHTIKFELFKPEDLTKGTRDSIITACGLGFGSCYKIVLADWTQQHHAKNTSLQVQCP